MSAILIYIHVCICIGMSSPGFAFADPPLHLCLLIVVLVVGVVSSPSRGCDHGSGLPRGVIGAVLCGQKH